MSPHCLHLLNSILFLFLILLSIKTEGLLLLDTDMTGAKEIVQTLIHHPVLALDWLDIRDRVGAGSPVAQALIRLLAPLAPLEQQVHHNLLGQSKRYFAAKLFLTFGVLLKLDVEEVGK